MFESEARLLREGGHDVSLYVIRNDAVPLSSSLGLMSLDREFAAKLQAERPDVIHIHNPFPWLAPRVYWAATAARIPVVQTLHNFRMLCCNGLLFRSEHPCEECLGRGIPVPAVVHRCYKGTAAGTVAAASWQLLQKLSNVWSQHTRHFIVLTQFAREKFIAAGIPAAQMTVKPHHAPLPTVKRRTMGQYFLFVGRLSEEKGVAVALEAYSRLRTRFPFYIAGDGPLQDAVRRTAARSGAVFLGRRSEADVRQLMAEARCLVLPSRCYEMFPRVIPEAYSVGLPVVASRLGGLPEMVIEGQTGRLFSAGDADELRGCLEWFEAGSGEVAAMQQRSEQEFRDYYAPESSLKALMSIYQGVVSTSS